MSKFGKELAQSAQEAVAHSQGRIQLKEFHADMPEEERELLLEQLCAPDPENSTETDPGGNSHYRSSSRANRATSSPRHVAASGRKR